jgi:hypothetical protein
MSVVTEQIKAVPPAVRPIVQAAIKMVREVAPRAEEVAYNMAAPRSKSMVWKLVRFTLTGHSQLFFYQGRDLDDGSGLLQGGGKEMRFIRLNSPADAERPEVKRMVRKAFERSA